VRPNYDVQLAIMHVSKDNNNNKAFCPATNWYSRKLCLTPTYSAVLFSFGQGKKNHVVFGNFCLQWGCAQEHHCFPIFFSFS
jgi:hypothetical protein